MPNCPQKQRPLKYDMQNNEYEMCGWLEQLQSCSKLRGIRKQLWIGQANVSGWAESSIAAMK